MRRLIAAMIFAAAGLLGLATPAVAAVSATACYDVSVTVNGEALSVRLT